MLPKLTSYQQTFLADGRTAKQKRSRWLGIGYVSLLVLGFSTLVFNLLPNFLEGWLVVGILILGISDWLLVLIHLAYYVTCLLCVPVLNQFKQEPWNADLKKSTYAINKFIKSFSINVFSLQLSYQYFINIVADLALFIVMVTAQYPILALWRAFAVAIQYIVLIIAKEKLLKIIQNIDDPLDAKEEDIDLMMVRLFNPDQGKS